MGPGRRTDKVEPTTLRTGLGPVDRYAIENFARDMALAT